MKRKLFFGEYLIQQGLITEEDMLEALAEQTRRTPSFEKLALEYGLLNMKQVFDILTRQAATDLSFAQVAQREGYLHPDEIQIVETGLQEQRLGIGEVLVGMGKLELEQMHAQLARFHEEMEQFRQLEVLLLRVELFKRLDAAALRTLSSIAMFVELEAGHQLVKEGDPADSLFVVVSGFLRITKYKPGQSRDSVYLGNAGPNEVVGEACIFGNARRSANVLTDSPVELLQFDRGDFVHFLRDHPIGSQSVFIHIINGLLHKLEFTSYELSHERRDSLTQEAVEDVLNEVFG